MPRPRTILAAATAVVLGGGILAAATGAGVAGATRADRPFTRATAEPAPTASAAPAAPVAARRQTHDPTVRPLRRLTPPDAVVRLPRPAAARMLDRLRHHDGVRAVTALDVGHLRVAGRRLAVVGADPGAVRAFTPSLTASSDALWSSVARGEMTVSYAESRGLRRRLGATLPVRSGGSRADVRIGAFASLGLGHAQAVVDRADAAVLGLRRDRLVFVSAPRLGAEQLTATLHRLLGHRARVHLTAASHAAAAAESAFARTTIPAGYLALYRSAARTCPGLPWTVLAGIGAVETGHGADVRRSPKGAVGPMQFLPSTFAAYGMDGDGDGQADVMNPTDAVYSAARYLCLWGAGRGGQALYDAVWAYNHADWYVRLVFRFANAYA